MCRASESHSEAPVPFPVHSVAPVPFPVHLMGAAVIIVLACKDLAEIGGLCSEWKASLCG